MHNALALIGALLLIVLVLLFIHWWVIQLLIIATAFVKEPHKQKLWDVIINLYNKVYERLAK